MTPVEEVYDLFVTLIEDRGFNKLPDEDIERHLLNYLKLAITEFKEFYRKHSPTIYKDEMKNCYIVKSDGKPLTLEEETALSQGMVLFWVDSQILRSDLMEQKLKTKDFDQLSNANMLAQNINLREEVRKSFKLIRKRYHTVDIEGLD